jgi:hypothetical protein
MRVKGAPEREINISNDLNVRDLSQLVVYEISSSTWPFLSDFLLSFQVRLCQC